MSVVTRAEPLVVVGAGPVGLAAAAHAQARGMPTVVVEAGPGPGASIREWGHVRLFSPWSEVIDRAAQDLLDHASWSAPAEGDYPTGDDWVEQYLAPLAEALDLTDEVEIRYDHRVTGLTKRGRDRVVDSGREDQTFTLYLDTPSGPTRLRAGAVIDASGTWTVPGPLGGEGLPALGERDHGDRIVYCIPDFTDPATACRYRGKRVAVAGRGASAQNTLVGLANLAGSAGSATVDSDASPSVVWLVRRGDIVDAFGGGDNDQLVARGALGTSAREAAESGLVDVITSFRTVEVRSGPESLTLVGDDGRKVNDVDEVIVVTGFRPDLTWLSEVRLDLDPVLSAPTKLAPLIDPNVHSCGTVYPHGMAELAQPETGLYVVGMKSYGRAPSFLALTGFEQTRSVVAAIAGDHEAATRVELVLPETGVCGGAGSFTEAPSGTAAAASMTDDLETDSPSGCCAPTEDHGEPRTATASATSV